TCRVPNPARRRSTARATPTVSSRSARTTTSHHGMMARTASAMMVAAMYSRSAAGSSTSPSRLPWLNARAILPSSQSDSPATMSSHPDAGKSTRTEALALHASAITQAGAVHGKAGRRGVTSDWMAMERARGISITSAALRFDYHDTVLNLLDTPGHADFSEDTYRVLSAGDCAILLLDS